MASVTRRPARFAMGVLCATLLLVLTACSETAADGSVHVATTGSAVGPIMEQYLDRAIGRAEASDAKLLVIRLDTPGGLDSSMRSIVKRIQRATVPIAVYVSPQGGRAASAGTFITMAAHVAAMAPSTSIGAASAINSDGTDIEGTLGRKVENDAVAFIRGIADLRGRNADWAEQAVRDAAAVDQAQAVELGVVDFQANDLEHLLRLAEGRSVEIRPGESVTLTGLVDAPRVATNMTPWEKLLEWLADPTVVSLLISLGVLGIVFELANPGALVPGLAGVVAITLGFLGFGILPVDAAGLFLIALGLALVVAEMFITSGILGAIGAVALVLGGLIAFRDTPAEFRPAAWLLVLLAAALATMVLGGAFAVRRLRRLAVASDANDMLGKLAVAHTPLTPDGRVFIGGEVWRARLESGQAREGDRVRIVGSNGLRLRVEKGDEPPATGGQPDAAVR